MTGVDNFSRARCNPFRFRLYNSQTVPEEPESIQINPDWLALARACVTADDWVAMVKAAVEEAKGGGANAQKAREFLSSFCLPKERGASAAGKVREVRLVLAPKPVQP